MKIFLLQSIRGSLQKGILKCYILNGKLYFIYICLQSNTNDAGNTELSPTHPETSNDIGKSQSIVVIKSLTSLERTGTDCNEGYFIDDRSEININFQKYRMVFVVNKDAVFYKKSAIRQARKVSPSSIMNIFIIINQNIFIFTDTSKSHKS